VAAHQLVLQTRIDDDIQNEASAVLAAMGLSVADAVRLLLTKVAREKSLPEGLLIPNPATEAAMREAESGSLQAFSTVKDLLDDLNAPD